MLFLLSISCLTPTTTHPYDVDNDGDGYTEFEGDCNDLNPDVIDDCNGQLDTILLEDVLRRLSEIEEHNQQLQATNLLLEQDIQRLESELTDLQDDYNEITSENLTHIQNQIDGQNTNINTLAQKIAEQNDEMENVETTLSTYVEEQIQDLLLEQQTSFDILTQDIADQWSEFENNISNDRIETFTILTQEDSDLLNDLAPSFIRSLHISCFNCTVVLPSIERIHYLSIVGGWSEFPNLEQAYSIYYSGYNYNNMTARENNRFYAPNLTNVDNNIWLYRLADLDLTSLQHVGIIDDILHYGDTSNYYGQLLIKNTYLTEIALPSLIFVRREAYFEYNYYMTSISIPTSAAFGRISSGYNCVAAGYSETIFQNNPFTTDADGNPFNTYNSYGDMSCWYDQSDPQYIQNSNPFGL